jgi:UDP-N-acetylenolpyruvoylglucosamine reductase
MQLRQQGRCDEHLLESLKRALHVVRESLQTLPLATQPADNAGHAGTPATVDEALAMVQRLHGLVRDGDLQALEVSASLKPMLAGGAWAQNVGELERCINDFDFEKALMLLEQIQRDLSAQVNG